MTTTKPMNENDAVNDNIGCTATTKFMATLSKPWQLHWHRNWHQQYQQLWTTTM